MTIGIEESLTTAPSARAWMQRVAHGLAARESAVIVFPATVVPDALVDAIARLAEALGCAVGEVDLARVDPSLPPLTGVMASLGLDPARATSIDSFVRLAGVPDVMAVRNLESLPLETVGRWITFVQQLARTMVNQPERGPAVLCAFAMPTMIDAVPSPAPRLQLHWWHGMPSATELRLACGEASAESSDRARQLWREHVLCSLAASDAGLAAATWNAIFDSLRGTEGVLRDYASKRGWTPDRLVEAGATVFTGSPLGGHSREPPRQRLLWAMGALVQTPEFGLELHSAALATLGREAAWRQRIWRGQLAAVLPLLEEIRLCLCQRMTDTWGSNWAFRWTQPDSEDERREVATSPLAASWGYLGHLHRSVPALARDTKLVGFINRAQYIRNELSHSRPILFPDFKALYQRAEELIWSS